MKQKYKILLVVVSTLAAMVLLWRLTAGRNWGMLSPAGPIANKERALIIFACLLSLVVVVPVFTLTIMIVYKYREGRRAKYAPEVSGNVWLESIWWTIPSLLIFIVGVLTWRSSHVLDPFRPLDAAAKPLTVQVVALDWKWLFIYPDQHVASVNFMQIPTNTPVNLQITSDAPMNSFWIPQLSGQIYAMSGMNTQLHLLADKAGDYRGLSANISGRGFSGMHFTARAGSEGDFNQWVSLADRSPQRLNQAAYKHLAQPSTGNKVTYYSGASPQLYQSIIDKYMMPSASSGMGSRQ